MEWQQINFDRQGVSSWHRVIPWEIFSFKSLRCSHLYAENEVKFPRSTQLIVVEPQPSLNAHAEDTEKQVELNVPTVFVWDLDETLIIFQTLSDGRYAALFDGVKDSHTAIMLGQRWERLILEICDEHFFYKQVILLQTFQIMFDDFSSYLCWPGNVLNEV